MSLVCTWIAFGSSVMGIVNKGSVGLTGIGDGGNELGMGKVKDAVRTYMPNGNLIACDVAADFAVTAGRPKSWYIFGLPCFLGPGVGYTDLAYVYPYA